MKRVLLALLTTAGLSTQAGVAPLTGATPQRAPALSAFPSPVAVRVTDANGQPVAGAKAYFSQSGVMQLAPGASGDCWVDFMVVFVCRVPTDADGVARFPAMAARYAANFTATVRATNDRYPGTIDYGETTLQFTSDPLQIPARLTIGTGNDQRAVIGTPLSPITARLEDNEGRPLRQAQLLYSPMTNGPGGFDMPAGAPGLRTDDNGVAQLPRFTADWGIGEHEAEVRYFDERAAAHVTAKIRYTTTNAQGGATLELGDLWWGGPSESGWGISVTQRGDRLFNVWFVYDDAGKPTWFVAPGGTWRSGVGSSHTGAVYWPRGTPWHAYDASRLAPGPPVGEGYLRFMGPEAGATDLNLRLGGSGRTSYKAVARQPFARADDPPRLSGVGGLWWGGLSQNGWGVAVHEHGAQLFIVWFTYDDAGMPTWFVMPDGAWTDSRSFHGVVYRTGGGAAWDSLVFDPRRVTASPVGTYRLRFGSIDEARMEIGIEGRNVTLDLARQIF